MSISEATRRDIFDTLAVQNISWWGRLEETQFLSRLFDLKTLPSTNGRFSDAEGDIWQHRTRNYDWDDDWVFYDSRFELLSGPDEVFLRFLCEMVHPVVRPDEEEVAPLVTLFNDSLAADGWELVEQTRLSGKPIFAARRRLADAPVEAARSVAVALDSSYIDQQITRMHSAVESDPELAIGTAKEFVETVCKTILRERGVDCDKAEDFPKLVRSTLRLLGLAPSDVPNRAKAADTIRIMLSNLATIANALTELRNPYGTGHGKEAHTKGLRARHARLAVGAASTLGVFLFETYTKESPKP